MYGSFLKLVTLQEVDGQGSEPDPKPAETGRWRRTPRGWEE